MFQRTYLNCFEMIPYMLLCGMLKEAVEKRWYHAADTDNKIMFVESGYIIREFKPTAMSLSKNIKFALSHCTHMKWARHVFRT